VSSGTVFSKYSKSSLVGIFLCKFVDQLSWYSTKISSILPFNSVYFFKKSSESFGKPNEVSVEAIVFCIRSFNSIADNVFLIILSLDY